MRKGKKEGREKEKQTNEKDENRKKRGLREGRINR